MAETVTIGALGHAGDGIAEIGDTRVFVPFTLPGETVTIERRDSRGRATAIVTPSPQRVAPACRHFGACGGCALQHMAPAAYRAWKRGIVEKSFALHGITAAVEPVVAVAPGSRRRAVFSAVRTTKGIVLGFHRRATKEIVAVAECPVLTPAIVAKLPAIAEMLRLILKPRRQARVTVVAADNGIDIAIAGAGRVDRNQLAALGGFASDAAIARLTLDEAEVFVNRRPEIAAGDAVLYPPPGGFLQAAASAEDAIAAAVMELVGDASPVADFFAGIGTFALRLAARAQVTAVEGDAGLVAALEESLRHARGLKQVTARRRDLFVNPPAPTELDGFGALVFDPPAAGAKALAQSIAASSVPRLAAVSCNPATLARDARILMDGGYRLTRVLPVDQFLFSAEIEVVAAFER